MQTFSRATLGLVIAAFLSLYGALDFYGAQIERNQAQKDSYQIGAQEQRFEALKRELGANGVAGYVSDLSDAGILLSAQHALAPVFLLDYLPYRVVVGNVSMPSCYSG